MKLTIERGYLSINGYGAFWQRRERAIWSCVRTPGCIELWIGRLYLVIDKPWPHPPQPANHETA
jgi:hypothetical protein